MGLTNAPDWLLTVLVAPFVGSFLGSLALRLPGGQSVVWGRSSCPACSHRLGPRDLFPLVSWVIQAGRCRYCATPVSAFYPVIELAALAMALWAASALSGWLLWATCGLGWTLLALAAIDHRAMVLPDGLTLPLIAAGLAVTYLIEPGALASHVIGAVAGFAVFAMIGWAYRRARGLDGLGLGDAKLLAAAGAWLSWTGLPSVVAFAALGALTVVSVRWLAGRPTSATERIAFGPYLCAAFWLVWLYGPVSVW